MSIAPARRAALPHGQRACRTRKRRRKPARTKIKTATPRPASATIHSIRAALRITNSSESAADRAAENTGGHQLTSALAPLAETQAQPSGPITISVGAGPTPGKRARVSCLHSQPFEAVLPDRYHFREPHVTQGRSRPASPLLGVLTGYHSKFVVVARIEATDTIGNRFGEPRGFLPRRS